MPTSDVRVIKALSTGYQIQRSRHSGDEFAICNWCNAPALVGTLLTRIGWDRGSPLASSAFLCDRCLLEIAAGDQAYIAANITERAK